LINQGLCEIAFHQQNKIRLTEVLFEGDGLVDHSSKNAERTERDQKQICSQFLFETLRRLRYAISKGKCSLCILSDAALHGNNKT
jgi:ATP-dependent DNA helicase RecQ